MIVLFALYPGIHTLLTISPVGAEAVALLPDVETMTAVLYFGLFAMSFDFISGYTGYLSFGHAAFYGAGAYFVVLAANGKIPLVPAGTSFMLLLVLAGLAALVLAIAIGAVSFRLSGVYFAMITLGFSQVLYVFVRGWNYVGSNPRDGVFVTGERGGFEIGVPFIDSLNVAIGQLTGDEIEGLLGAISLSAGEVSYYAIGGVVVVCYLAMQRILHSPFGRVMVAIRENEERARAVGYDTFRYKLAAFAVSGFFAGIAGALFAGFQRSVTPDDTFYFLVAGDALLASIIGGFGTLVGPLYGRLFDESVREFLSTAGAGGGLLPYLREHVPADVLATELVGGVTVQGAIEAFLNGHASLYLGLLFVLFVLYVPNGLLGTLRNRLGGTVASWTARQLERRR
ncbi:branched-chain amino acid ABC transporter permease [Halococcus agarilyticus]|uniref:branched-chain amino acid ABC transporter permease n=1 Tax=Halococcus agarilyticus TaxID=1232219 RepID=UPI000677A206